MFRNLWYPLQQPIVRLKLMKNSHINVRPICLRFNSSVLIIFTKDARYDHLAFEDKRLVIHLVTLSLSFLVFLEFVGSVAVF